MTKITSFSSNQSCFPEQATDAANNPKKAELAAESTELAAESTAPAKPSDALASMSVVYRPPNIRNPLDPNQLECVPPPEVGPAEPEGPPTKDQVAKEFEYYKGEPIGLIFGARSFLEMTDLSSEVVAFIKDTLNNLDYGALVTNIYKEVSQPYAHGLYSLVALIGAADDPACISKAKLCQKSSAKLFMVPSCKRRSEGPHPARSVAALY